MEQYNFNQHENSSVENLEELEEILEQAKKTGRMISRTSMTEKLAEERRVGTGSRVVVDEKLGNYNQQNSHLLNSETSGRLLNFVNTQFYYALKKENVSSLVAISPIVDLENVYEEKVIENKAGLFGKKVREVKKILVGTKNNPVHIESFNPEISNSERGELAYKIVYYTGETEDNYFTDPTTRRTGCRFDTSVVLPESVARKVFAEIQKNPKSVNALLKKLDPVLMEEIGPYFPKIEKILIVPEDDSNKAFVSNPMTGAVSHINPEYIKEI